MPKKKKRRRPAHQSEARPAQKTEKESDHARAAKYPLWKRLLKALPVIIFSLVLTFAFSRLGILHRLERLVLDVQTRLSATPSDSEVAIVEITDEDYDQLFDGQSPLDPSTLQRLINAIAKGSPAVIGVDVITSPIQFKKLEMGGSWPPVIWTRESYIPEKGEAEPEPLDVLGGKDLKLNAQSGLSLLIDDEEDAVTRYYARMLQTKAGLLPSFPWAIASRYAETTGRKLQSTEADTEERFINYRGDQNGSYRYHRTASQILAGSENKEWQDKRSFQDKVVLLGGSYRDYDRHETPLGKMAGLNVMASAVETELQGGGDKVPHGFIIFLLECVDVFVLYLLFHRFPLGKAFLLGLLVIALVAPLSSLISFKSYNRFFYFASLLLGVLIYQVYEHYRGDLVMRAYAGITGKSPHQE